MTFVENHDTEWRTSAKQDPLLRDTLAANAFMLAMPGTPCVFLKHWQSYRNEIKSMAAVRQLAGITNTKYFLSCKHVMNITSECINIFNLTDVRLFVQNCLIQV